MSAFALVGFVMARQILMPRTNQARDANLAGDADAGKPFKRLHGLNVMINGARWLAVFAALWMLFSFLPIAA